MTIPNPRRRDVYTIRVSNPFQYWVIKEQIIKITWVKNRSKYLLADIPVKVRFRLVSSFEICAKGNPNS